jgi:predicted phosphate transport protein (TIGR00153 family)
MEIFTKKKHLNQALDSYCQELDMTIDALIECMDEFFAGKSLDDVEKIAKKVRKAESRCDSLRREIEQQLFAGALMPGARGDIFMLIEALDKVPNKAEDLANFVALVGPQIPDELHEDIREILSLTVKCTRALSESVIKLFKNLAKAGEQAQEVEIIETEIDKLERRLIRRIFQLELPYGHRMMLREMVTTMCAITDRAENASDRVEIIAVKRKT